MILPTKRIRADQALILVGGRILRLLYEAKTISRLWEEIKKMYAVQNKNEFRISYDWFILSIDFLFTIGAIDFDDGLIRKIKR